MTLGVFGMVNIVEPHSPGWPAAEQLDLLLRDLNSRVIEIGHDGQIVLIALSRSKNRNPILQFKTSEQTSGDKQMVSVVLI